LYFLLSLSKESTCVEVQTLITIHWFGIRKPKKYCSSMNSHPWSLCSVVTNHWLIFMWNIVCVYLITVFYYLIKFDLRDLLFFFLISCLSATFIVRIELKCCNRFRTVRNGFAENSVAKFVHYNWLNFHLLFYWKHRQMLFTDFSVKNYLGISRKCNRYYILKIKLPVMEFQVHSPLSPPFLS